MFLTDFLSFAFWLSAPPTPLGTVEKFPLPLDPELQPPPPSPREESGLQVDRFARLSFSLLVLLAKHTYESTDSSLTNHKSPTYSYLNNLPFLSPFFSSLPFLASSLHLPSILTTQRPSIQHINHRFSRLVLFILNSI